MKTRSTRHKGIADKSDIPNSSSAKQTGRAGRAYGDNVSICINTDCMLRKKAGGCLGFEGCPGFKSR
ncbi:MAG: hypothetical protein HZB31_01990 [Nitrospirae bacterium]|nr:hypothetical protein [Nitrospirota bacterium]